MSDTLQKLFEQWYQDNQHPEELLLGVDMGLKQGYRKYYKEKQNGK